REQRDETSDTSFADILKEFESTNKATRPKSEASPKGKGKRKTGGTPALRGTVVGISGDFVLIDYGAKSEGVIPKANLLDAEGNVSVQIGDKFDVTITGY